MAKVKGSEALVITCVFDAPVEKVWKAWTDPEEMKKWWGPKNFTSPTIQIDFKEGGKYLYCMRGVVKPGEPPQDLWSTGTYKEIRPLKKIVVTDSFADEQGNVVPSTHYGMEGFPLELEVTITFEDLGDKTKMTVRHVGIPAGKMKELTGAGWNESFDKLAESLK